MRPETGERLGRSKTLREHFVAGIRAAHRRRPISFYVLVLTPFVLLLGLQMADFRGTPWRFAGVLSLLFAYCGVVLFLALSDIFKMARQNMREHREAFRDTLGDETFFKELGSRVDQQRDE